MALGRGQVADRHMYDDARGQVAYGHLQQWGGGEGAGGRVAVEHAHAKPRIHVPWCGYAMLWHTTRVATNAFSTVGPRVALICGSTLAGIAFRPVLDVAHRAELARPAPRAMGP